MSFHETWYDERWTSDDYLDCSIARHTGHILRLQVLQHRKWRRNLCVCVEGVPRSTKTREKAVKHNQKVTKLKTPKNSMHVWMSGLMCNQFGWTVKAS